MSWSYSPKDRNTPPSYGPSGTRALTFIPNTSPYHLAEASGSRTYNTTCATRLTLGMCMTRLLDAGRHGGEPSHISDLWKLAPFLAPTVTAVVATEQVAVFCTGQQQEQNRQKRPEHPDRGVR